MKRSKSALLAPLVPLLALVASPYLRGDDTLCIAYNEFENSKLKRSDYIAAQARAEEALEEGDYAAAVKEYGVMIEFNEADFIRNVYKKPAYVSAAWPDDYYKRGVAHRRSGSFERAISDFTRAIEIIEDQYNVMGRVYESDTLHKAYYDRAGTHNMNGDFDLAVAGYDKALELGADAAGVYNDRGYAKMFRGDFDAAVADFEKAMGENPGLSQPYYNRGMAHYARGDERAAKRDFDKAVGLSPDTAEDWYGEAHVELPAKPAAEPPKPKTGIASVLKIGNRNVPAPGKTVTAEEMRDVYAEILRGKGYEPEKTDKNAVRFRDDGKVMFVYSHAGDHPPFVEMVCPANVGEAHYDTAELKDDLHAITAKLRVVKAYLSGDGRNVAIAAEFFMKNPEDFGMLLEPHLILLRRAFNMLETGE